MPRALALLQQPEIAIVFGLSFGTILTLIVTPALLALPDRLRELLGRRKGSLNETSIPYPG